jgi:GrpB-like predicted nucleotidyltransferase (UPF0157 family)
MIGRILKKIARIGLPDDIVHLQPYTVIWKWMFFTEKIRLKVALGGIVVDIQHVGSTAISDMVAKPIIELSCSDVVCPPH